MEVAKGSLSNCLYDKEIFRRNVDEKLEKTVRSGNISHAYIFEGKDGTGRVAAAKRFALNIVKQYAEGKNSFANAEEHPDIIIATEERFGDKKKKTPGLSIGAVRALKSDVYTRPYMGDKKVYIIPCADSMAPPAQNSLLKVFEEPPSYCTIILISENANVLLQTIRSRAVLVKIPPFSNKVIEEYLLTDGGQDAAHARLYASISGGSIGKAQMLIGDKSADKMRDKVIDCLVDLVDVKKQPVYEMSRFIIKNDGMFAEITDVILSWFEDIVHIKFGVDTEIVNADKKDKLRRFSGAVTKKAAFNLLESHTKYLSAIDKNVNFPIAVRCMVMEFWEEIHDRNYRSTF